MPIPFGLPQVNPKKLLFQLPLAIIIIALLLHSTVSPENIFTRTTMRIVRWYNQLIEGYITDKNFLVNPSFEDKAEEPGQIPGWKHFGFRLDTKTSSDGVHSAATLDLVKQSRHTLSQSFLFPIPSGSKITVSFALNNSGSGPVDQKVNLITYHYDLTSSIQTRGTHLLIEDAWQPQELTFTIGRPAYRTVLEIEINTLQPAPTYIDNVSLKILTSQQVNRL